MNNRTLLTGLLGVSTAASAAAQTPAKVKAPQTRPNIIIIYTDDMGIGDLSCTNTGWIETPAIDRLASQGLVMNNYYSAAPVSSPSPRTEGASVCAYSSLSRFLMRMRVITG